MTTTHHDHHTDPTLMTRVIIESPYNAPTAAGILLNTEYARQAMRDCLERGEAPLASHLLYTQPGILNEQISEERAWGIAAGLAWSDLATHVFYVDHGWSRGMTAAREYLDQAMRPYEIRSLGFSSHDVLIDPRN